MSTMEQTTTKGFFGAKKKAKKLDLANIKLFGIRLYTKRHSPPVESLDALRVQEEANNEESAGRLPVDDAADVPVTVMEEKLDPVELLHRAILDDDMEAVESLLAPETVDQEIHETMRLSDMAAGLGKLQLLQVAVGKGARLNHPNSAGHAPIHYALSSPDPIATVTFLLDHGADPNVALASGDHLLHKACSDSSTALLELLLNREANPELKDQSELTPLHRACINDLLEHASLVLGAAPNLINWQDIQGRTPLHIAVANQNIALMKMLLDHGATIDKETTDGKTAIDFMMTSKNRGALRELIRHFTDRVLPDTKVAKPQDLYKSRGFQEFLDLLLLIDSETRNCYYNSNCHPEEEQKLVDELIDLDEENLQDVMEFQTKVMAALKTNVIHSYSKNREIVDTIAIFTTKYILFREDIVALHDVMKCGIMWDRVSIFLEDHISILYSRLNRDANMISKQFVNCFMKPSSLGGKRNELNMHKLNQRIAKYLGMSLPTTSTGSGDESREVGREALGIVNPIETLAVWSILTGRLNLTVAFLRRAQFEIVPLSILSSGILRKLGTILETDDLPMQAIMELANHCEQVACEALTKAIQVDMSEDKWVTYQYLLHDMPAFGNLSCIHLAANCRCDSFLRIDVCQKAMDVTWQRFLGNINPFLREFAVFLGIVPLNPLLAILLYAHDGDNASSRVEQQQQQDAPAAQGSNESFALQEDVGPKSAVFNEFGGDWKFESRRQSVKNKLYILFGLLYCFYHIPSVKFRYFTLSHVALISVMSYTVLMDFNWAMSPLEVCAYILAFGFVIEELRELSLSVLHDTLHEYGSNKWNIVDGFACVFMVTAFVLRLTMTLIADEAADFNELFDNHMWFSARFFYSLACLLMWVKLLNIARVNSYFGPKLTMMSTMVIKDLLPFLYILFIYLFGFGIFMTSLMHPNGYFAYNPTPLSTKDVAKNIFHISFYSMFGEYHLDQMTGTECAQVYESRENTTLRCPHPDAVFVVPYVLLPIYIIITTILLLSLIVALFSKTIDEIDSNSRALWEFERFAFVYEYENYSALAPPLNILDIMRGLVVTGLGRWLPSTPVRFKLDLFDPDVVVHYLINQAIGLRNDRARLAFQADESEAARSGALGREELLELLRALLAEAKGPRPSLRMHDAAY